MKRYRLPGLLLFIAVGIISCQPEPDEVIPPLPECKAVKSFMYDPTGAVTDSSTFFYTGSKLTKVQYNTSQYYSFEYSGDRIVKRNFYHVGSSVLQEHDVISYNSDGTISKIERFDDAGGGGKWASLVFTYANGKLFKVGTYYNGSSSLDNEVHYYYTGDNITKQTYTDHSFGAPALMDSTGFNYDSQPNYFNKQSNYYALTDPFFLDLEAEVLPFTISKNNVIKAYDASDLTDFVNLSYTQDSKGNLATLSENGILVMRYVFECQ